jgi:hypothetical protein
MLGVLDRDGHVAADIILFGDVGIVNLGLDGIVDLGADGLYAVDKYGRVLAAGQGDDQDKAERDGKNAANLSAGAAGVNDMTGLTGLARLTERIERIERIGLTGMKYAKYPPPVGIFINYFFIKIFFHSSVPVFPAQRRPAVKPGKASKTNKTGGKGSATRNNLYKSVTQFARFVCCLDNI